MAPALISKQKTMIRTIVSNSGLSLASDNIFYVMDAVKNGLLAMTKDDTNDTLTLTFRQKDNSQDGVETIVLKCEDNKADKAAEDIVSVLNGIASNAQMSRVVNLFNQKVESVKGVNFAFTYESGVSNEDLVVDPDDAALADETITLGFQGLGASSGPYSFSAFIKNTDSTGSEDVVINGTKVQGTLSASAAGKFELSIPGVYDNAGVTTAIPATATDIVNTAEVTLTNINSDHSESISAVIDLDHES